MHYFGVSKDKDNIKFNEKDYNHIKNVMRYKKGDNLLICFDGIRYKCSMNEGLKDAKIISLEETFVKENSIRAYIPLTVDSKMSFVLQKGVELGVNEFYIVEFTNSKYNLNEKDKLKKITRYNEIIRNASMQAMREDIPSLKDIIKTNNIEICNGVNIMCSLDKNIVKRFCDILTSDNSHDKINIVYGPEGGITHEEEELLIEKGYIPISLGNNVLRTETVLINVMSIVNYLKGF